MIRQLFFLFVFLFFVSIHVSAQCEEYVFDSYNEWSDSTFYDPLILKIKHYKHNTFSIIDESAFQMPFDNMFKKQEGKWYVSVNNGKKWSLFFDKKGNQQGPLDINGYKMLIIWQKTECKDGNQDIYCFKYRPYNDVDNPIILNDSTVLYYVELDKPFFYFTYNDGIIGTETTGCIPTLFIRQDKVYLKECMFLFDARLFSD